VGVPRRRCQTPEGVVSTRAVSPKEIHSHSPLGLDGGMLEQEAGELHVERPMGRRRSVHPSGGRCARTGGERGGRRRHRAPEGAAFT
jgi:hypothetical protein